MKVFHCLICSFSNYWHIYSLNMKLSGAAAMVFMHIRWHAAILLIIWHEIVPVFLPLSQMHKGIFVCSQLLEQVFVTLTYIFDWYLFFPEKLRLLLTQVSRVRNTGTFSPVIFHDFSMASPNHGASLKQTKKHQTVTLRQYWASYLENAVR